MLKIEYILVENLRAYAKNARTHSDEQIQQIVNSINAFGFTNPVLIDEDNELIAGHGRTEAAKLLGMDEIPAIRLTGLDDDRKRALRISDNSIALNSGWNLDLLAEEVQSLDLVEFDLELLGFDDDILDNLLNSDAEDGYGDGADDEDESDDEKPNVTVAVGPYRFQVDRKRWDEWENKMRQDVGFHKEDIVERIKGALSL